MKLEVTKNTPDKPLRGYFNSDSDTLYLLHNIQPCEESTMYTWFSSGTVGLSKQSSEYNTPEYWAIWGFTPIYEDEEVKITL